ncbi:MAG TPA: polyphenol oxidase family protein [Gemmatimonadales bacterium]|nr:polyphenol oxidase family protein [Gemmatimonadales bacterium]
MPPPGLSVQEVAVPGPVPRFEIPEWRERYGVVAGVTGRGDGPGRGFDLGLWTDAPVGEVMTRWAQFRRVEPGFSGVVLGNQVHGIEVMCHPGGTGWIQVEGIDGHVTAAPGLLLTVTVADCIPVYLVAPEVPAVALVHSGWRGTAGGILQRAVEKLGEVYQAAVDNMVMHCGVGICGACYEVGREVMDGCGIEAVGSGPWHAELRAILAEQGRGLGLRHISTSHWCSRHDMRHFYSHRGSGGRDGRMVAYLGLPASA